MQQPQNNNKKLYCQRHKNEQISHFCVDLKCMSNPFLCSLCFQNQINRQSHYEHEKNVLTLNEGIQSINERIKKYVAPAQKVIQSTFNKAQNSNIMSLIGRNQKTTDQLQDLIINIKAQLQVQTELILKQFQKSLLAQKQEYFKLLDSYQKCYKKNIDYLRSISNSVLQLSTSTKYYANINNFNLKICSENRKKTQWISRLKRTLAAVEKDFQNGNLPNEINNALAVFNKFKMESLPVWKGQDIIDKVNEIKNFAKRILTHNISIPEPKLIQQQIGMVSQNPHIIGNGSPQVKSYYY